MTTPNQQIINTLAELKLRNPHTPAKKTIVDQSYLLTTPALIARRLFEEQSPKNKYTGCNCSKSQCLKMYCACFSVGKMCDETCLCQTCKNNNDNMDRSQAINEIIIKDPHAFSRKSPLAEFTESLCNCKKSACMKKYCDCYRGGKQCGVSCQCIGCCNREKQQVVQGSVPSKAIKLQ